MSIAKPVAQSIAQAVARSVSGAASGGAGYNPANQPGVLQVLDGFSYAATSLDGLPVLQSSVGTLAVPRGQRCVLFDGVDDYATPLSHPLIGATQFTYACWVNLANASFFPMFMAGENPGDGEFRFANSSRQLDFATAVGSIVAPTAIPLNTWVHCVVTGDIATGLTALYQDGVQVASGTVSLSLSFTTFYLGAGRLVFYFPGKLYDARIYNVVKTPAQIAAIYNQHLTPSTLDRTGLVAAWWLNEESGTTHYDWSGNARHLTAANVTQSTYHATDSGVKYNAANELGYTLSGSVVIPRNEADTTKDALGGSLQYAGPIALPAVMEVPCLTVSGTEYLDLPHLTGSETVVSKVGTSTVSIAAGRINLTAGTVSSILLSDGTRFPLQEGAGSSNTNRTCYNVDGTGRHATLTNGTVATMWAGRLSTVRDWCIENGGSIAANGAFIPGRIGSSLDAAGNAKTIAAGQHGNPFSRFSPNNWSAPSLVNIGSTSSDLYAPSGMAGVQAESVADTRYGSQQRYAAFASAQSGTDKTSAESWAAG